MPDESYGHRLASLKSTVCTSWLAPEDHCRVGDLTGLLLRCGKPFYGSVYAKTTLGSIHCSGCFQNITLQEDSKSPTQELNEYPCFFTNGSGESAANSLQEARRPKKPCETKSYEKDMHVTIHMWNPLIVCFNFSSQTSCLRFSRNTINAKLVQK